MSESTRKIVGGEAREIYSSEILRDLAKGAEVEAGSLTARVIERQIGCRLVRRLVVRESDYGAG